MPKPNDRDARFVDYLRSLAKRDERGALAALRRGLGKQPGTAPETFRYVVPFTSTLQRAADADAYFLVAALFATHPEATDKGNVGATFAGIRRGRGRAEGDEADSLEKRFVALLNAHIDDLPNHLRHAVGLARSAEVGVNWLQLLADIRWWSHPDHIVQREWAREFWGRPTAETAPDEPAGDESEHGTDDN